MGIAEIRSEIKKLEGSPTTQLVGCGFAAQTRVDVEKRSLAVAPQFQSMQPVLAKMPMQIRRVFTKSYVRISNPITCRGQLLDAHCTPFGKC